MPETMEAAAQPVAPSVSVCSAAVERCRDAYQKAYRACLGKGRTDSQASSAGTQAYHLALPQTDSPRRQGHLPPAWRMASSSVPSTPTSPPLLAAARVALATHHKPREAEAKNKKTL